MSTPTVRPLTATCVALFMATASSGCASAQQRARVVRVEVPKRIHDTITPHYWRRTEEFDTGTGVCIEGGRVATAHHVLFEGQRASWADIRHGIRVMPWGSEPRGGPDLIRGGEGIRAYATLDLVVLGGLKTPSDVKPARLATRRARAGDRVTLWGYGRRKDRLTHRTAKVLSRSSDGKWLIIDTPVYLGDSGGPVFARNGQLIGMIVGGKQGKTTLYENWTVRINQNVRPPFMIRSQGHHEQRISDHALVLDLSVVLPQLGP